MDFFIFCVIVRRMNSRVIAFSMSMMLLLSVVVSGIDLEVDYLEGSLEYRSGADKWTSVAVGASIPEGSTLRLSDRGFAEISAGSQMVTLTKDGVYESGTLFAAPESRGKSIRQVLGTKFASLLKRERSSGMTVAAVRGSVGGGEDFISWEDDSIDLLAEGISLYDKGDFGEALEFFRQASIWESGMVQREGTFRYALTQQALGNPRGARETLSKLRPEPGDSYIGEYTVTMGTLYLESMEYAQADAVLSAYLDTNPQGDAAQAVWLLSAMSLDGQGNRAASRDSLRKAVALGPRTDIGLAADAMLN